MSFEPTVIGEMASGYLEAVFEVASHLSDADEWLDLSIFDIESRSRALVEDDCRVFSRRAAASTRVSLATLVNVIPPEDLGWNFCLVRFGIGVGFTRPEYGRFGKPLGVVARGFPPVEFSVEEGRFYQW